MPTALFSAYDKSSILELAKKLSQANWHLMATEGTAHVLRAAGLTVKSLTAFTGSPEILDGRVKTLHPAIYAGILAKATPEHLSDLAQVNANLIDLVVIGLMPFDKLVNHPDSSHGEIINHIDVGGTELVRAAGKNYERVAVVVDPEDQNLVIKDLEESGRISGETRELLAIRAFKFVANYDQQVARYLEIHRAQS